LVKPSPAAVEVEAIRRLLSQASPLVSESHALSYALVMALASTPGEALTRREIDALCQVAYEPQEKLREALQFLQKMEQLKMEE
jgi:hypothetical protein